jgi:hypothetical protein
VLPQPEMVVDHFAGATPMKQFVVHEAFVLCLLNAANGQRDT